MAGNTAHPASYRDPAGFVFRYGDRWYRQINRVYAPHYDLLMSSGLYQALVSKKYLVQHTELPDNLTGSSDHYKTLLPEQLGLITYPAEWSPGQLTDAALLTLRIMRMAIGHGLMLKDATPRNIQFVNGRPLFIDTLSFELYDPAKPWVAYRQFCESMLFPLYLHRYLGTGTSPWIEAWPEGIPASVTARLLPSKSRWNLGVWLHVRLQSRVQQKTATAYPTQPATQPAFSLQKMQHLLGNLENIIESLDPDAVLPSTWNNYYASTILSMEYLLEKEQLVDAYLNGLTIETVLDLGANDGHFSRLLALRLPRARIISADSDWQCIEKLHAQTRVEENSPITPLCIDLANPTPASGFRLMERESFPARAASQLVLALALVHHLVIGKSVPLQAVAAFFAELTKNWLIVEFVPTEDEKTQLLLLTKTHFHQPYDRKAFEHAFDPYFIILRSDPVPGSHRTLYLMKKKT